MQMPIEQASSAFQGADMELNPQLDSKKGTIFSQSGKKVITWHVFKCVCWNYNELYTVEVEENIQMTFIFLKVWGHWNC